MPKTLHVDQPSSKVDWAAGKVELLTEAVPWQANGRPRRAGVSSFGISGTNAHVILEEAPEPSSVDAEQEQGGEGSQPLAIIPLALSAKSEPALNEAAERLASHLRANPQLDLTDVAYSLATTRSAFEQRAVVLGSEREELLEGLGALGAGAEAPGLVRGIARAEQKPVFLFGGQGSQHARMAAALLEGSPVFARHIDECERALAPHVDWSLTEVLADEQGEWLDRLDIVQPALFAVMVSLAELWRSCGVKPAAVIGHSQGEIAAAYVAGGLSLADAALIVARRSAAMTKLAGKGAMLSVSLSVDELGALIDPYGERVSLAATNGPASQVLSGDPDALKELEAACEQDGIRAQRVAVDYAAHSAQIEDLREELLAAFAPINPQSGSIAMHSTVSGEPIDTAGLDGEYWYRNLRQTVLFEPALRSALEQGRRAFVEISPHPVLSFAVEETVEDALTDPGEATVLGTLRRDQDGPERFALSLAQAHSQGTELDWRAFFSQTAAKHVPLPTYPFQRKRYWLNASAGSADASSIGLGDPEHPLLGAVIEDPRGEGLTLTGRISLQTHPWLADHMVGEAVLLPGTAFLEVALQAAEAADCRADRGAHPAGPADLARDRRRRSAGLASAPPSKTAPARSQSTPAPRQPKAPSGPATPRAPSAAEAPSPVPRPWPAGHHKVQSRSRSQSSMSASPRPSCTTGRPSRASAPPGLTARRSTPRCRCLRGRPKAAAACAIHPALLDAALHAIALAEGAAAQTQLPFSFAEVSLASAGPSALRVEVSPAEQGVSLLLSDGQGLPIAQIGSLALRPLDPAALRAPGQGGEDLLGIAWQELALEPTQALEPLVIEGELDSLWGQEEEPAPETVLWRWGAERVQGDPAERACRASQGALEAIQRFLAEQRLASTRLAILTGELSRSAGKSPRPDRRPLWGFFAPPRLSTPSRFVLLDSDGSESSERRSAQRLRPKSPRSLCARGARWWGGPCPRQA